MSHPTIGTYRRKRNRGVALTALLAWAVVGDSLAFAPLQKPRAVSLLSSSRGYHKDRRSAHSSLKMVASEEWQSKNATGLDGRGRLSTVTEEYPLQWMDSGSLSDSNNYEEESYSVAIRNTALSILVSLAFGAGLWLTAGQTTGEEFFAGYIVEKSLSVDNLFVFLLLFDFFKVPPQYQGRILTWGIAGSIVMRAVMITLGAAALQNFHGILLAFAAILIYSAVQVLYDVEDDDEEDLNANPVVQLSKSIFPSTETYDGDRFFTVEDGMKKATPLFICMIAVELSDVVFAVDSIPAVFGVTENPLVVFSSNMFAILGLRSLYPVLSKAATDLKYLEPAVAVVLAFIGGKMIAEYYGCALPTSIALAVIISVLGIGVFASVWEKRLLEVKESETNGPA